MKCNYCKEVVIKSYQYCPKCSTKVENSKWSTAFIFTSLLTNYVFLLKRYAVIFKQLIIHPQKVIDGYLNRKVVISPHYFLFISATISLFISKVYSFFFQDPQYLFFGIASFKGINLFALPLSIAISIKLFFLRDKVKIIPYHIYSYIIYLFSVVLIEMALFSVVNDLLLNQISFYYGFWNPDGITVITGMSIPMIIYFYYAIYKWIKMSRLKVITFVVFSLLSSYLLFYMIMALNEAIEFYILTDTSLYYDQDICWTNLIFETCFNQDYWYVLFQPLDYEIFVPIQTH